MEIKEAYKAFEGISLASVALEQRAITSNKKPDGPIKQRKQEPPTYAP